MLIKTIKPTDYQAPASDERRLRVSLWKRVLHEMGIILVLILLLGLGIFVSPKFLTSDNLLNVLHAVTLLGIVSIGVAFITYGGNYVDLSIPAIMALSGFVAISMQRFGIHIALMSGLAAGMIIGLINGFVIGYVRLNPIIWTLAMVFMLDGVLRWAYGGNQVYPDATMGTGAQFVNLSRMEVMKHLPVMSVVFAILAFAGHFIMRHTRFGSETKLTGSAYAVARMSGVDVRGVVLLTFVLSAFTTSIAGLFLASLVKLGTFQNGEGYDFDSVTAVVLGGMSLAGGRGSIWGVVGGVLVIGVLMNIMTLVGLDSFQKMLVKGAVFIAVVALAAYFARKSGRAAQ
jgi:ribose/xylose/arabinose/galactoside ABC-type transport system permease subunit